MIAVRNKGYIAGNAWFRNSWTSSGVKKSTVPEIIPEGAALDRDLEIPVGGRDASQRKIPDLVGEERAAGGHGQEVHLPADGSGELPLLVPEEPAEEQLPGDLRRS